MRSLIRLLFWSLLAGLGFLGTACKPPCEDVICDTPPPTECADAFGLVEWGPAGTCDKIRDQCTYSASYWTCQNGCANNTCVDEDPVWGWVAVYERDATPVFHGSGYWFAGIGATFGDRPRYSRALPHYLDRLCQPAATVGACTLFQNCETEPTALPASGACAPACQPDEECVAGSAAEPACVKLPPHFNLGSLSLSGLKTLPLTIEPNAADRYEVAQPPLEPCWPGSQLAVNAARPPFDFNLAARCPDPLGIAQSAVEIKAGTATTVSWTPAADPIPGYPIPGIKVEVVLLAGPPDPAPVTAVLRCEAEDAAGQVTIDPQLGDLFRAAPAFQKGSSIARYFLSTATYHPGKLELLVGSIRALTLQIP